MSEMEIGSSGNPTSNVEELYAKPYKKGGVESVNNTELEGLYDRLDRENSQSRNWHEAQLSPNANEEAESFTSFPSKDDREPSEFQQDDGSLASYQRGLGNQSIRSTSSTDINQEREKYQMEILETKDTNDIVKEISNLGLEKESDRLITALRNRFELETAFIDVCAKDGITVVEGDSDSAAASEHQSIGGLRVKGMRPNCVNYDEYDPDITSKYCLLTQGLSKENMANDAAELRRRAANMLWAVENMERMIDPNSRVRYVRQETDN